MLAHEYIHMYTDASQSIDINFTLVPTTSLFVSYLLLPLPILPPSLLPLPPSLRPVVESKNMRFQLLNEQRPIIGKIEKLLHCVYLRTVLPNMNIELVNPQLIPICRRCWKELTISYMKQRKMFQEFNFRSKEKKTGYQ